MEGDSWRKAEQPVAEGSSGGDWRAQMQPDARRRMIKKIMENLKRCWSDGHAEDPGRLENIATRLEEKIYRGATSQADYLRKIALKMLSMEQKNNAPISRAQPSPAVEKQNAVYSATLVMQSQVGNQGPLVNQSPVMQPMLPQNSPSPSTHNSSSMPAAVPSIAAICESTLYNVGQTSSMHNISGVSQVHAGEERMMQRRQLQQPISSKQYQQQSLNPLIYSCPAQMLTLNQKVSHRSLLQPNLQEQQQSLLRPTQMQSSGQEQPPMQMSSRIQQAQSARMQSAPHSSLQQNQQKSISQSIPFLLQQHPQSLVIQEQAQSTMQQQPSPNQQQTSSAAPVLSGQQQLIGQQFDISGMKQTQSLGQQTSVSDIEQLQQHRLAKPKILLTTQQAEQILNQQQQLGLQSDIRDLEQQQQQLVPQTSISGPHVLKQQQQPHQQQHLFSSQPTVPSMQPHQLQKQMPQENRTAAQQQSQQSFLTLSQLQGQQYQHPASNPQTKSEVQPQSSQLQQQLALRQQPNPSQQEKQQRFKASGALFQSQNATEQQKELILSQRGVPNVSSNPSVDSMAQTRQTTILHFQEEIYQKIESLKELAFIPLSEFDQNLALWLRQRESLLPPARQSPQWTKMRNLKTLLERILAFVLLSKCDIQPTLKEKIPGYEKQIFNLLEYWERMRHSLPLNQQQFQQASLHAQCMPQQQPYQVSQLQLHENHVNQLNPNILQQQPSMQQHLKQQHEQHQQQHVQLIQPQKMQEQLQQHHILQQKHQILPQRPSEQMQLLQHQKQLGHKMPQAHTEDSKERQSAGAKPGSYQQHFAGQHHNLCHQQLKMGASFQILSPQDGRMPQYSSPQVDQQGLSSLPRTGALLKLTSSSHLVPSPSTQFLPSPMPDDSKKHVSGITLLPNAVNLGLQTTLSPSFPQPLVLGTPGTSASPLLEEFPSLDVNQVNATSGVSREGSSIDRPIDRLVKAIASSAPSVISSSMSVASVVSMIDMLAGSAPGNGPRAAIGEDLAAMAKCHMQAKYHLTQDGNATIKKMKRQMNAMPLIALSAGSPNNSFKQHHGLDASELVSTATSRVKRQKIKVNHSLMEEIEEINQQLIDTVVSISDEDADLTAAAPGDEGTVITCSVSGVALSPKSKSQFTSAGISPILPLRLLVPANYPKCSPILLDRPPLDQRQNFEDLSDKAKSSFSMSLRSLSQPISLGKMARTWDSCAHKVILEYAQRIGGGSLSTTCGTWENCVGA